MTNEEREEAAITAIQAILAEHGCTLVVNPMPQQGVLPLPDGSLVTGGTRFVVAVKALPEPEADAPVEPVPAPVVVKSRNGAKANHAPVG